MLTFRVPDPGHRLAGVRLAQEVGIPGDQLDFRRSGDDWELQVRRPPVSRMEYLLELYCADGSRELLTDQANPLRVQGAFGEKIDLEFPGYRPPDWLAATATAGITRFVDVPARSLGASISALNYDPASWNAWGERGTAAYFNNPLDYVGHLHGDHLDWLRGRVSLLLVCGQGRWEDTTGSLPSTKQFAELLASREIRHELDLWGHDVPHDWPSWRAQLAHHMPRFC